MLSDEAEQAIEARMENGPGLVAPEKIGRAKRIEDARGKSVCVSRLTVAVIAMPEAT